MIRFRLAPRDEAKMWKDAEASWNEMEKILKASFMMLAYFSLMVHHQERWL
jgi:hypothetical protein